MSRPVFAVRVTKRPESARGVWEHASPQENFKKEENISTSLASKTKLLKYLPFINIFEAKKIHFFDTIFAHLIHSKHAQTAGFGKVLTYSGEKSSLFQVPT
jgi:hypothetical protein